MKVTPEHHLYCALEFIANHDEGDHGVDSFRKYAKKELQKYWQLLDEDGRLHTV